VPKSGDSKGKKGTKTGVPRGRKRKTESAAVADKSDDNYVYASDAIDEREPDHHQERPRKKSAKTSSTSPQRRNPRRSVSKPKYRASDSDDDDESYADDEHDNDEDSQSGKETAARPKYSSSKKRKGAKNEEVNGEIDDNDLDDDDDFSNSQSKSSKRRRSSSTRSGIASKEKFLQLKPGAKCITKYGVVEIISDDQLPAGHHKSKVTASEINAAKQLIYKQKNRYNERKMKLMDEIAIGSRHRRDELMKIYLNSIGPDATANDDKVTIQKKIWQYYCTTFTPEQILMDGKSWENYSGKETRFESLVDNDPCFPADYYPDRIVKCKLVKDERQAIDVVGGEKAGSSHLLYVRRDPVDNVVQLPIILYLTRRELTRAYDPDEQNYICSFCGEGNFKWRNHAKYHIDQGFCTEGKLFVKEDAEKRILSVENEALSGSCSIEEFLSKMHGDFTIKGNTVSYKHQEEFGNPCKIKPSKKDKMPPWIVFNDKRSPLYPETYVSLGFRRGSQNRNFYNKKKLEDDYISRHDRKVEKKKRIRMSLPGSGEDIRTSTHASRFSSFKVSSIPPLPPVADIDFGSMFGAELAQEPLRKSAPSANRTLSIERREITVPFPELGEGWIKRSIKRLNSSAVDTQYFSPDGWKFRSLVDARNYANGEENRGKKARGRRKQSLTTHSVFKSHDKSSDTPVVIDTQVLASECEAGRYPSINPFQGDHNDKCTLCRKPEVDDTSPLLECDFCENSVHQVCLNKAMLRKDPPIILREAEPHDSQMCHECLTVCLNRRSRAETRRVKKWHFELRKAGLLNIPDAAGLTEEVNLKRSSEDGHDDSDDQNEADAPTYKPCPIGGPGGLICCSYCNASYSRVLSNTAKEMEAQSIARKGQEVSEILELLVDAKQRLCLATDLSRSNDERRSLLKNNEGALSGGH
jgi:hypothetical protein